MRRFSEESGMDNERSALSSTRNEHGELRSKNVQPKRRGTTPPRPKHPPAWRQLSMGAASQRNGAVAAFYIVCRATYTKTYKDSAWRGDEKVEAGMGRRSVSGTGGEASARSVASGARGSPVAFVFCVVLLFVLVVLVCLCVVLFVVCFV